MADDAGVPPTAGRPGLLSGVRVLELSVWRPGPYATQLLAGLGAEVLKVEPPGGDPMRGYPEIFAELSADKRSLEVDLKTERGRTEVLELAAGADVVVEGFRPGVADRLGVGEAEVRAVNPAVVYCSVSGFGRTGPLAAVPGHDLNYLAWAGALAPDGGEPRVPAIPVADLAAGMAAAFAVCAALVGRGRTGEGEHIDLAMADVLATWTGVATPRAASGDADQRGVPGYGTFATSDGRHLTLGVVDEDHFWRGLCDVLELAEHRDLAFTERIGRLDELQAAIASAVRGRRRDAVVAELLRAGVPVAPVLDRVGMTDLDHFGEREVVTATPWADPTAGYPVRFEHHPARRTDPPPSVGEHQGGGWAPRR